MLQCRELFKGSKRRDTIFDKIFKGALDEFGREMKTVIGVEMQVGAVVQVLALLLHDVAERWISRGDHCPFLLISGVCKLGFGIRQIVLFLVCCVCERERDSK